ncbi:putative zinc finger protein [Ixodes scapularis]
MEDPCALLSTGTSFSQQGNGPRNGVSRTRSERSDRLPISSSLCSKASDYLTASLRNDRLVDHDPFQDGENLEGVAVGDIACERIIADGEYLAESGAYAAGDPLRLSESAELDVKKVDEWLKTREDTLASLGLVFELKTGSEDDLFGETTPSDKLNLFSVKDLLDVDVTKEGVSILGGKGDMAVLDPETLINSSSDALMTDQELESLSARGLDFSPAPCHGVDRETGAAESTTSNDTSAEPETPDENATIQLVINTASGEQQTLHVDAKSLLQCAQVESILPDGQPDTSEQTVGDYAEFVTTELSESGHQEEVEEEDGDEAADEPHTEVVTIHLSSGDLLSDQLPSAIPDAFQCDLDGCGRVFNRGRKLRVHLMSHTACRPFKCPEEDCDWAFATEYKLKRHQETHAGKKDYTCDVEGCGRSFTTVYNLKSHMKLHKRPTFPCPAPECGLVFVTRRKMELHLREHDDIDAPYKCPEALCGKAYYSANTLASHLRVHMRLEFRCPFEGCGRLYNRVCKLRLHVRQHTGERPYICPFEGCAWTFASASKLTRHTRKHTGDRRYVCPEPDCRKAFMRPEHLKGHMVVHSGCRPFECPHPGCSSKFAAKSSLYVHLKKHAAGACSSRRRSSAGKPRERLVYPCPMGACSKRFTAKGSLRQHILKCHSVLLADGSDVTDFDSVPDEGTEVTPLEEAEQELMAAIPLAGGASTEAPAQGSTDLHGLHDFPEGARASEDDEDEECNGEDRLTDSCAKTRVGDLDALTPSRVLQENHSGSARTDFCSNHLQLARKKRAAKATLEASHLGKKLELSNGVALPCADVVLTSSAVGEPISSIELVQVPLIQDDCPSGTDIYSELSVPVATLLAEHTATSELGATIHLQDLD